MDFLWIYVGCYGAYFLALMLGAYKARNTGEIENCAGIDSNFSLGIVIPAYNELSHLRIIEAVLSEAIPNGASVVVVDDGSTDGSSAKLARICHAAGAKYTRHSDNRGKSAALNTGIAALDTDLVLTLDADTTIDFAGIQMVQQRFSNSRLGAIAVRIDADSCSRTAICQTVEYCHVLNFERVALSQFGLVFTVPGAAALWRRAALASIGGFSDRTCAEDTDASISLGCAGWRIAVELGLVGTTECPPTIRHLLRQRARWIWGTIQASVYALIAILVPSRGMASVNAAIFITVTLLNGFGFIVATAIFLRIVTVQFGVEEMLAGAILFVLSLLRLTASRHLMGPMQFSLLFSISALAVLQAANTLAFWLGLLNGRAIRRSWQSAAGWNSNASGPLSLCSSKSDHFWKWGRLRCSR